MEQNFRKEVQEKLDGKKRKSIWKRILGVMMCIVVFCTTYMLILPAITKETETFCGMEEHDHTEACYENVLVCDLHVHTQECYISGTELICTLPTEAGHIHGEDCVPVTELVLSCGQEEIPGHTHGEDCECIETAVLSCGLEESEEHTHDDTCYTVMVAGSCDVEETEGHTHGDACYTAVTTYSCGLEEQPPHVHTETCYANLPQLNCTLESADGHVHAEGCYTQRQICTLAVHTHSAICYSNPSADLEAAADWEATLPGLSGVYVEDVLAIAESQMNYTESSRNYIVEDDGSTKGYTRYGAWYGIPYGDWCAMFVSFCLDYAGMEGFPQDASCPNWVSTLSQQGLYDVPSEYVPKAGDIIFFDWEQDGSADHVGLVKEVEGTTIVAIEGNSDNCVTENTYEMHDHRIAGYGKLSSFRPVNAGNPASVDLENADAWAVLLETESPAAEMPQEEDEAEPDEAAVPFAAGRFSMRSAATTFAAARVGTPLDLTPYINTVNMFDIAGNPIANGSVVTEGDMIEFKIDYTITGQQLGYLNGETVTVKTDTLVYSLPGTFQIVQDNEGNIINSAGVTVGNYVVDSETGTITMTFDEAYVDQNARGIQIQGNVSFFSVVTKITDSDGEHQDFQFTDTITLGITINEKQEVKGDLSIEKQKTEVDGEELVYEVKVTSTEGTNGPITITDQMSTGLTFVEGVGVWKGNSRIYNVRFNPSADNSSFTMTLPEMAAGDSYTIRYRCHADLDLLGEDLTVENTASVTGKNNQNHDLEDEVTVEHTFKVLEKTGMLNEDGSITWIIIINRDKMDISGWVLEDILSTGSGNVPYSGKVNITDVNGNVLYRDRTLPFTFPEGSDDMYVVTYTTTHSFADGAVVYNKAILRDDDTEIWEVAGTAVGSPIEKSGEAGVVEQDENGVYRLPITWTVTIDTANGAIPGGKVFFDRMHGWPSDDMYMTYDQLMAAYANMEAEIRRVSNQGIAAFEAEAFVPGNSNYGPAYSYSDLINNRNNCQSLTYKTFTAKLGSAGIPQGQVLTFTYETYGLFPNNILSTTRFINHFEVVGLYETDGTVDYTIGAVKATKYAVKYFDPNNHTPGKWHWDSIDWNCVEGTGRYRYEDLHEGYLAWGIELSVPPNYSSGEDIIIYEDLPDGVTVKALEMVFTSSAPAAVLPLSNLEIGQTYSLPYTLHEPQDYEKNWNRPEGKPGAMTVKVTETGDLEITVPAEFFINMGEIAAYNNADEWYGHLYIYTQINEDFGWTPVEEGAFVYVNSFENRITLKDERGIVIDVGSQTQRITRDDSQNIIRKEASVDDNDIITYTVLINEYAKDLIQNSGILRIHDELTYESAENDPLRLRMVPGSVKLYEVDMHADGTYTRLGEVSVNYDYEETSSEHNGVTSWTHTIDMVVPDGKALLLVYSYRAIGYKNATHDVLNVCTIEGVGEGNIDGDHRLEIDVKDATAQADTKGVMIYKVDANSNGLFLEDAIFNIYIWNEEQNKYIIVHHPENGGTDFSTDSLGMIVLDNATLGDEQFAYNTAYYIVERESPNGYYVSPERYYFYILNSDTENYPECIPEGFVGHALSSGDIIYRENVSETTEIRIEKYWMDYNGTTVSGTTNKVSSITIELWQMLQGDPDSAKLYGTYNITPDEEGNWFFTIDDLPRATRNEDGTRGTNYLYYIKEVEGRGFVLESTQNNEGINSGTIRLTNREEEGYDLPKTGGIGTHVYAAAGTLLVVSSAACLVHMRYKRRRRENNSS